MKYLFKGIAWIFINTFLIIFWLIIAISLFLWHFNFKHIQSPKQFWANSIKVLKDENMLQWTIIFLVIAIIAAIFGFGGIAIGAAGIAKILFFTFLVLFVLTLIIVDRANENI